MGILGYLGTLGFPIFFYYLNSLTPVSACDIMMSTDVNNELIAINDCSTGGNNMGICKCSNSGCPVRSTCYRWTAKANQRYQAYNAFKGEDCGYYWEVNEAKRMLGGNYDSN